jgi:hypothetical protein
MKNCFRFIFPTDGGSDLRRSSKDFLSFVFLDVFFPEKLKTIGKKLFTATEVPTRLDNKSIRLRGIAL